MCKARVWIFRQANWTGFAAVAGNGLKGKLGEIELAGGNREFIEKYADINEDFANRIDQLSKEGKTALYFCENGG